MMISSSISFSENDSIVCIYHNFFVRSSIDGHLGWFHNLVIVNSEAMDTGVQVPLLLCSLVLWGPYIQEW
jgi:hypothetical protein